MRRRKIESHTFKVGDKIICAVDFDQCRINGYDLDDDAVTISSIDDYGINTERGIFAHPKDLMLFDEAKIKLNKLEQEFEKLRPEVNVELEAITKQWAALIDKVQKSGLELVQFDKAGKLRDLIQDCGWEASSLSC
jgi:hypothetical protein